jgi:hypothetical protein
MEIRESSFNFPRTAGSGPQGAETTVSFARGVRAVAAGIIGYSATFEDHSDQNFGRLIVELGAEISSVDPNSVIVRGSFGLRDWSNEWDDGYSGNIQYVVLAELEPVGTPGPGQPRGDLIIVDAEFTQAVQHFRSYQHLDSANVFPDNSIRLVAEKPTAVRLYVDYDATSGLPIIEKLWGSLEVVSGSATQTLFALQSITPRRDNQIDRGLRWHTLNFIIPANICQGTITIRAKVFSEFDMDQFSQTFERDLSFDVIPSLRVMAVGIEYTGPDITDGATDADLAAPEESDFPYALAITEVVYPIPSVTITSYTTMTYDKEVKSDINDASNPMDDLKDVLRDMRGDSDDIVYGLFNIGVDTGSVAGSGGRGVAVGRIGEGEVAPHEIGHALGRQHAPCDNVTRCATPRNPDENYPHYSGYDSDSIGEYGFDTSVSVGKVLDPADAHDIMGYSPNKWISPYSYKALMSRIPEQLGGAGAEAAMAAIVRPQRQDRGEWIKRKTPHLFLHLTIRRDRTVYFREAFHFPAFPQAHGHMHTDFAVELQDNDGNALKIACLYAGGHDVGCSCGCGHGQWPMMIDQAIPFDSKATKLVLYECDKAIYEQAIPAPPRVEVKVQGADQPEVPDLAISWNAGSTDKDSNNLWYLVQWRDGRGTWRGCAPRTQATSLRVRKKIFGKQKEVMLRVLATSGIATGEGVWQGELKQPRSRRGVGGDLRVHLAGVPSKGSGSWTLPAMLRVSVFEPNGATVTKPKIRWYDGRGVELGRGHTFNLHSLPIGFHVLQATVFDTGYGQGCAQWMIERTVKGEFRLHRGNFKPQNRKE